ncbi:uncharacterized protein EV420DRAFT_1484877 [Desarmillaria tabescens]|uniref:Uncharacterized protein n=1 Tax=Armillaria tabescens TaxID=1929756 RepID=A0AA39JJK0_ARMTA|nr:uncharacterized protein EV420DRAFT_1484877 [Desarmillaria tabescens]KAK0443654.1 hypothetical protein EV420DRAFT_1484877 [Desarmillaria tabescens]
MHHPKGDAASWMKYERVGVGVGGADGDHPSQWAKDQNCQIKVIIFKHKYMFGSQSVPHSILHSPSEHGGFPPLREAPVPVHGHDALTLGLCLTDSLELNLSTTYTRSSPVRPTRHFVRINYHNAFHYCTVGSIRGLIADNFRKAK